MDNFSVYMYDTTLRDGNQAIGVGLSLTDKLAIAEKLSDLGVPYIEGGWPNSTNRIDSEFYKEVKKLNLKSKIAAFGSTKRANTKVEEDPFLADLLSAEAPVATIYGKSWDLHVKKVIRCSLEENLDMIAMSVEYLKKHVDELFFDAEHFFDGYKNNPDYALKTVEAAMQAGADVVVLCDTNGGTLPDEYMDIFNAVKAKFDVPLGVHNHNDTGCADANSILAVTQGGAVQVQGTINGIGERCGNANLCTIIPSLQLKKGINVVGNENLKKLREISIYVSEIANVSHNIRLPYVGEAAFSHKAGAHVDGVRKVRESFEHINPESVGNKRHFILSDQAGSGTILEKLKNVVPGLDKKDPLVKKLLGIIKDMEAQGYHFEAADGTFQLLVEKYLGRFEEPFEIKGFRVIEEKRGDEEPFSEATIKVGEKEKIVHTAADGDGPVNALDNALRKALLKFYPSLEEVKLDDFKVRVLNENAGTAAKVRVLIESCDGKDRWGTIGVSTNIIEAAWIALVDSLKFKLMKDSRNK